MAEQLEDGAAQEEGQRPGTGSGSLGLLVPDMWYDPEEWPDYEPEEPLGGEEALERYLGWVEAQGVEPWEHQEEALMDLALGDHVILGTPTGSGKSLVAQGLLFMAMCAHKRSYYTAPIRALVSEKFFNLVDVLGRENVGMVTGETSINPGAPVVCCTEEILANRALREGDRCDIACVTMDEFHYYSDPDRGWAWQVPLLTLPRTQFLLMSATLGDTSQIAAALQRRTGVAVDQIMDAPRPVPLSYSYVDTPLEGTVELALRAGDAPLYIVHFSQDAALNTAQSLASYGVATKEQRDAVKEAVKGTRFTTAFGKILQRLLGCGVGVHHAGMLPRYRLLVEKLAQQGLLPVICGTDTLGVGINVPIHTVLLTQLTKFDGRHMRRLRSREFHQIAGRAGRSGFDTEGLVIAEAPEYDIENARAAAKAGGDPKKLRKIKKKQPPEGFVGWGRETFDRLVASVPETLTPRLKITHSMVLAEVEQGGDAYTRVLKLIEDSAQPPAEKERLAARAAEIFATLIDAGVVQKEERADGSAEYLTTVDLPDDFALDQPLSPFLLAALELLDPESETYTLDVVSMVEATLEDPRQILRVQEKRAREQAVAEMKADGVEYDERMERLQDVTYPKPLADLLEEAFEQYCEKVPWARDYELSPKSVLRDMLETAADFKGYIAGYNMARFEGALLRYLSEAYRALARTVPADKMNEELEDIVSWLGLMVRTVDSSLVDEWESAGAVLESAPPLPKDEVVRDRRGLVVLVRNALMRRVTLAARGKVRELGQMDVDFGFGAAKWERALDEYAAAHAGRAGDGSSDEPEGGVSDDELADWAMAGSAGVSGPRILTDADARSARYFSVDESDEKPLHVWHVHQVFSDPDGDHDFGIMADVDLDATQDEGEAVFKNYRVGFIEDLLADKRG